jgi:hypothetical protein
MIFHALWHLALTGSIDDHWYNFWTWFTTDDWAALGSMLSGFGVLLTGVSLILLWKQTKASLKSLKILQKQQSTLEMRNLFDAFDTVKRIRDGLVEIASNLQTSSSLETLPSSPLFPSNWADVVTALKCQFPETTPPAIGLGFALQNIDMQVKRLRSSSKDKEKAVVELVNEVVQAINESSNLVGMMKQ